MGVRIKMIRQDILEINRILLASALVDEATAVRVCATCEPDDMANAKQRALFVAMRALLSDGIDPGSHMAALMQSRAVVAAHVTATDLADLMADAMPAVANAILTELTSRRPPHGAI